MPDHSFTHRAQSLTGPADRLAAVAPRDDAELPLGLTRGLYVGAAGTLSVVDRHGGIVELQSGAFQYHPIRVLQVRATGTTAGGIVALY